MPRQTRAELEQHLAEQFGFLSASAQAYDQGTTSEAKRLAHTLRVLLHTGRHPQTGAVTSLALLSQVGWLDDLLVLDSGGEPHPGSLLSSCTLVYSRLVDGDTRFFPKLDDFPRGSQIPRELAPLLAFHNGEPLRLAGEVRQFDEWWSMPVLRDATGATFSRSQLVLSLTNKDGGSHVDPKVGGRYRKLTRENSLGQHRGSAEGHSVPMDSPVPAAVRQVAYEVAVAMNERLLPLP